MYILKASEEIDQISLQPIDQQNHRGMLCIFLSEPIWFLQDHCWGPIAFLVTSFFSYSSSATILGKVKFVAALSVPVLL